MMSSFNPNNFAHDEPNYAGQSSGGQQGLGGMLGSSGGGNGMNGLASIFSGLFGNSDGGYGDAMKQFKKYFEQANGTQNPFYNAGQQGMGNFQNWLSGMQDPSKFINGLMGQYQESPFAKFQQQQGVRAGQNAASASGLTGSTPFAQQLQQNAQNISSQDQNQWLQNVLGVNNQYGQGQQSLMQGGQHAGDFMSQLAMMMGNNMGAGAYGQKAGQNQDMNNIFSGIGHFFGF